MKKRYLFPPIVVLVLFLVFALIISPYYSKLFAGDCCAQCTDYCYCAATCEYNCLAQNICGQGDPDCPGNGTKCCLCVIKP